LDKGTLDPNPETVPLDPMSSRQIPLGEILESNSLLSDDLLSDYLLIVDDNATNLAILSQSLDQLGLKLCMARDGERAIHIAQQHAPVLILLDVTMPRIDGFETCARLKANPATQAIPIIFMTALVDAKSKAKAFSLGAVDYITKPFDESEVLARVNVHLQLRQLMQTLEKRVVERTEALSEALENLQRSHLQLVQSEKMSALGELVAGIAHEMNNPIGCIVNNVAPAMDYVSGITTVLKFYQDHFPTSIAKLDDALGSLDVEFALQDLPKILKTIKLSADRIKDLSISLRNFSRSDSTSQEACNLHDSLDSTLTILGHRLKADKNRPKIEMLKSYGELPEIVCYPSLLNQVFMNVLANAIDALENSATPQIQIHTETINQQAIIRISDNGIGMSEDTKQQAFEQLFTTKGVGKGTGLGLSISRQIIEEKHHGKISFASELNQGTEFTIVLPIHPSIQP
jgi:signal transduction histidine kinase